jgi:dipeptidyl aminopeptidase/acylaminoacyl peptidase
VLASLLMSAYPPSSLFTRLRRWWTPSCLGLLIALVIARSAVAAPTPLDPRIGNVIEELEKTRKVRQVSLSPDGQMIAWAVDGRTGIEIQVAPTADPSHPRRLTAGSGAACMEEDLAWSPDSKALAFTSDCNAPSNSSDQLDVYIINPAATGASARRLTHLHGGITSLAFSPDGLHIACLFIEGATRPAGALAPMKPPAGVIGVEGLEIQRVGVVEAASGEFRQVSPATLHVYEYDWAPDSRRLVYTGAAPPGENNWWVAQLYTQPLAGGKPQSIFDPAVAPGPMHGLQIAVPRWSPDGQKIAFIGGLMSDQGATGGDVYVIPITGGTAKSLTWMIESHAGSGTAFTSAWIHWTSATTLVVSAIRSGSTSVLQIAFKPSDVPGGSQSAGVIEHEERQLFSAPSISDGLLQDSLSLSADNSKVAFIQSSFEQGPEVWAGTLASPQTPGPAAGGQVIRAITDYNGALKPLWGKAESVHWNSDSFAVQGWLLYPAHYDPGKKYPLIVSAHGGPSSAVLPRWPDLGYNPIAFSALDYFVLMPNPRGSYGEGEAFTQANRKDFGYGDLRDILAGVDTVSARFPIDQQRIGITGWSYGGFMTMFAVTQTQRFHAAVAGAGIANWQSYYGENSIDQWMTPFFGASVYENPEVYAKSSAIDFIRNVKTPTLVVVGDRDGECPAPQSFEFWHALRAEHVPTELVVYPDEGHRFNSPQHRRDVLARALAWFEEYMPPQS